jgi:hypothetical protein
MDFELNGFDPLLETGTPGGLEQSIADEAIRREVLNVLKSYTGYFDIFSELLQNALDAVDARRREEGQQYQPKIWVEINIEQNYVRVVDNGTGMSSEQFRFCFRPNVSFKSRKESRGHKGVGATFIAYGFSNVCLATKRPEGQTCATLGNGRRWAEDLSYSFDRPTFATQQFSVPELLAEKSGTSVQVHIEENQRPKLAWIQATNAEQWFDLLRIKTPVGGVYLTAKERALDVEYSITVVDLSGNKTTKSVSSAEYYYPHEIPLVNKTKSIAEIEAKMGEIEGDPTARWQRLPNEFRRLDAVYEVWTKEEVINHPVLARNLDDEQKLLLERHSLAIYGCFLSTAKTWTDFQKNTLKVRPTAVLLRGGLQLASDFMPQGDLSVIPLTSTIGYQNNTHIVIHLTDGNPDMGRKVFQPEVKAVADELSRRVVDVFKKYLSLMREDTGAPQGVSRRDLRDFILAQEQHRQDAPLALRFGDRETSSLSEPQSEQDVIALFHELIGMNVLQGYGFLATSESERYDSIFVTNYDSDAHIYSVNNSLGVADNCERRESVPFVLEYKYNSDALVADFSKEKKFAADINLLVCWEIGQNTKKEFAINSFLVGDEGSVREFYGTTHSFYHQREKRMEVICLADLVKYLMDQEGEVARQNTLYN